MAHQELGKELLERVKADLVEYGTVEQFPKMAGRQMVMVIGPKKVSSYYSLKLKIVNDN